MGHTHNHRMLGRVSFVVVVASISACSGASWTPPAQAGPHTVAHDTVQLSSPRGAADVVYPVSNSSDDKFGFVSFCHGGIAGLGLTFVNYQADMEIIASYGFVVVATQVNENGDSPLFSEQQRAVIKTCKADLSIHKSLSQVDFTRVGVAGHSMGGIATRQSCASTEANLLNIKAGWCQHPCSGGDDSKIKMPMLYTTGTLEPGPGAIGCPQSIAQQSFKDAVNANPRILLNIQGANHLDPMYVPGMLAHNRELIPGALFLACHVNGDSKACDKIYGQSGKSMCSLNTQIPWPQKYNFAQCQVMGNETTTN